MEKINELEKQNERKKILKIPIEKKRKRKEIEKIYISISFFHFFNSPPLSPHLRFNTAPSWITIIKLA